jgi:hypothetical protein
LYFICSQSEAKYQCSGSLNDKRVRMENFSRERYILVGFPFLT